MRKIYEKFNIYIYLAVPSMVCLVYFLLSNYCIFDLEMIKKYQEHKFEVALSMLGVLLTVYGFMMSLPENNFRSLMRRYKHDEIINNTIFFGIMASLVFVILYLLELLPNIQDYVFIFFMSEVVIATTWIYKVLKYIGKTT